MEVAQDCGLQSTKPQKLDETYTSLWGPHNMIHWLKVIARHGKKLTNETTLDCLFVDILGRCTHILDIFWPKLWNNIRLWQRKQIDCAQTPMSKKVSFSVEDSGFLQGGGANSPGEGGSNIRFCQIFPKTAWNWKNLDPPGGGARVPRTPLRSATAFELT